MGGGGKERGREGGVGRQVKGNDKRESDETVKRDVVLCCALVRSTELGQIPGSPRGVPPDLAEGELDVGELLLERVVHVLLQVRRLDVLYHRGLDGDGAVLRDHDSSHPQPKHLQHVMDPVTKNPALLASY